MTIIIIYLYLCPDFIILIVHLVDKKFVLFRFDGSSEQYLLFGSFVTFQECIDAVTSDKHLSTCYMALPIDRDKLISFKHIDNKILIG